MYSYTGLSFLYPPFSTITETHRTQSKSENIIEILDLPFFQVVDSLTRSFGWSDGVQYQAADYYYGHGANH